MPICLVKRKSQNQKVTFASFLPTCSLVNKLIFLSQLPEYFSSKTRGVIQAENQLCNGFASAANERLNLHIFQSADDATARRVASHRIVSCRRRAILIWSLLPSGCVRRLVSPPLQVETQLSRSVYILPPGIRLVKSGASSCAYVPAILQLGRAPLAQACWHTLLFANPARLRFLLRLSQEIYSAFLHPRLMYKPYTPKGDQILDANSLAAREQRGKERERERKGGRQRGVSINFH